MKRREFAKWLGFSTAAALVAPTAFVSASLRSAAPSDYVATLVLGDTLEHSTTNSSHRSLDLPAWRFIETFENDWQVRFDETPSPYPFLVEAHLINGIEAVTDMDDQRVTGVHIIRKPYSKYRAFDDMRFRTLPQVGDIFHLKYSIKAEWDDAIAEKIKPDSHWMTKLLHAHKIKEGMDSAQERMRREVLYLAETERSSGILSG